MLDALSRVWANPYMKVFTAALVTVLLIFFIKQTMVVWLSLFIAFMVAYLLNPAVKLLSRLHVPRWLSVSLVTLLMFVALGFVSIIISQVMSELLELLSNIAPMLDVYQQYPERLNLMLPKALRDALELSVANVQALLNTLTSTLQSWLESRSGDIMGGLATLFSRVLQVILIPVMTAYFLYDYQGNQMRILRLFPPRHREFAIGFSKRFDIAVGNYFRVQLLIALIVGVLTWIGLYAMQVPLALALSFISAVGNIIPVFGPVIAAVPAVLLATSMGMGKVFLVALLFLIVNQLDAHVLKPMIFSKTSNMHPLVVIVVILLGLSVAGGWGALLAVPVAAFIQLLVREFYFDSSWYQRHKPSSKVALEPKQTEKAVSLAGTIDEVHHRPSG